jgi:arginase
MKNIRFIEVRSELGAGTRGASLGIDALKIASLEYGDYLFGRIKSVEIKDKSRLLYKNPIRTHAKRIMGVRAMFERIAYTVQRQIQSGYFPVIISGDHSSAGGSIAGVKLAYPDKKVGVIWIDAHADLHSPYTTPSGNIHGMPLATALGEDNLLRAKNKPEGDVPDLWNDLKDIGGISPKITPDSLVFIGLRDFESAEMDYITQHSIPVYTVEEVRGGKIKGICEEVLSKLSDCEVLYVSFDIDSLDKALVPGTGTPVSGGLSLVEAEKLLMGLLRDPRLVCFEITEINPILDRRNETAEKIFPLFRGAVNQIGKLLKKKQPREKKK